MGIRYYLGVDQKNPPGTQRVKAWTSLEMDNLAFEKFQNAVFFQDIQISFQWVTANGLKPPQFFSFQNISTNTVTRGRQSFGWNEP